MAKRKRYTDEFKAGVIILLESEGYPDTKGALQRVAAHTHVPPRTLRAWYKGEFGRPTEEIILRKKGELVDAIEDEMYCILNEMREARPGTAYRDLAWAFGVMFDKRQILTGGPTENINVQRLVIVRRDD